MKDERDTSGMLAGDKRDTNELLVVTLECQIAACKQQVMLFDVR